MCYDLSFSTSIELITDYIPDLIVDPQVSIEFDTSIHVLAQDYQRRPVVVVDGGQKHLKEFEWGVVAPFMDTPDKIKRYRSMMGNARSEKIIGDKKSIWHELRHNRCLVPVQGTYEHREIKGWKKKVPYYTKPKDRKLFCIPGLYHYVEHLANTETGEITGTFAIITRTANSVMRQIHNSGENAFRMPLFLPKKLEMRWLEPNLTDGEIEEILDYEMPSEELEYYPVWSIRTPNIRPDKKLKNEPFIWENLPPLGEDTIQRQLF